jgi:hypothetical protein
MSEEIKEEEKIIDYLPTSKALGRKRWYFVWAVMALTWLAMAGIWFYFDSKLVSGNGEVDPVIINKVDKLSSKIERISEALKTQQNMLLVNRPTELPPSGVSAKDKIILDMVTRDELESVADKINLLESDLEKVREIKSELETGIAENKKAISENIVAESKDKKAALIMVLAQVQSRLRKGLPFDRELRLVEVQAQDDPIIQQHLQILKAHSEHGVTSIEMLKDRFKELAGAVVSEAKKAEENNIWDRTKNEFVDIIAIRRVDNLDGDDAESIVARAEKALNSYNISEAVLELDSLDDRPKKVIADWLVEASSRVAVEYALDKIWNRITQIVVTDGAQ